MLLTLRTLPVRAFYANPALRTWRSKLVSLTDRRLFPTHGFDPDEVGRPAHPERHSGGNDVAVAGADAGETPRHFDDPDKFVKMNGREVFKFATRVMVSSAEKILAECGKTVDEVDVYVPHQANKRIIDYAAGKLGIPEEKVVVNVDRYGNTSSGSIPLALADARADGRLREGELVLMTGMGAGLTWGSALCEWTTEGAAA